MCYVSTRKLPLRHPTLPAPCSLLRERHELAGNPLAPLHRVARDVARQCAVLEEVLGNDAREDAT